MKLILLKHSTVINKTPPIAIFTKEIDLLIVIKFIILYVLI